MAPTPDDIARFRLKLAADPKGAELVNATVWAAIADQIAALPDDARTRAEDAYETLWLLLSDDDTEDDEEGES